MWWFVLLAILVSWMLGLSGGHATDGPQVQLIGTVNTPHGGLAICRDPSTGQTFSLKI
jgi:hypothetical protein